MRVAFIHPDLGLGGAERLVVDAALALQQLGHTTTIYTAFQDASRTFPEVAPPSPQIPVRIVKTLIPRALFGRLQAFLAALRCAALAFYVCLFCRCDAAIVDIVSLPVIVFSLFRKPVLFYCHYPDKLLAATLYPSMRQSQLKVLYRRVVDGMEAFSLRFASAIVCNSRFTSHVFAQTFPSLPKPSVVYPCVAIPPADAKPRQTENVLLSLNRFERKKSVSLAVETLAVLRDREPAAQHLRLVLAGGYDERLRENVEYFDELERLVSARELEDRVTMLRNVNDAERRKLIRSALAVLYTPSNEHFGIVPLEAMAEGVPVIAVNSGGPTESIQSGVCGMLCESSASAFAEAIAPIIKDSTKALEMGRAGHERASKYFSRDVLGKELQNVLVRIA